MSSKSISFLIGGFALFASAATSNAAPKLRLSQTTVVTAFAQGANASNQTVEAANIGDGTLNLQVSSNVPWITPSVGPAHACTSSIFSGQGTCNSIQLVFNTGALAKGTYTGVVTVNAPNAIDAPQTIVVTAYAGGGVPDQLTLYAQPGGVTTNNFSVAGGNSVATGVTQSGGQFLSVVMQGQGSFAFNVVYGVTASAANLSAGDYSGTVTVAGSSVSAENHQVPVVLHVTNQPILQANPIQIRAVQGDAKQTITVPVSNAGLGTLSLTSATVAATSGGSFLSAQTDGATVTLIADPTGLTPGVYTGALTIASNAANASVVVPVEFDIEAASSPVIFFGGAVNNATFASGESLAQGDIVALFGDQLVTGGPTLAGTVPLTASLGGIQVLVNGAPAPLYYTSAGQIDFEVPVDAAIGDGTVQVVRGGTAGNMVSVKIAHAAPRLLVLPFGNYGVIQTYPDNSLPIPVTAGYSSHPAKVGDTLTIYGVGFGGVDQTVSTGTGAPQNPPANITNHPQVCFGNSSPFRPGVCIAPSFAGLSPGYVGLYQINVQIPAGTPSGDSVPVYVATDDGQTNIVNIAVQ